MIYMSSNATSDGRFTIAVSFELGTNLDIAQMQVQNRVAVAQPRVPADVRNIGISVTNDAGVLCGHALAGVRRRSRRSEDSVGKPVGRLTLDKTYG